MTQAGMLPLEPMNARDLRRCAVVLPLLLAACATPMREWRDLGERELPFEDVWNGVVETCSRHGFVIDERESDRGRGVFTSRWRTSTMGFGQSRRQRVRAELIPGSEAGARVAWQLRFCVERQTVGDMARSLDPRETDWKPDGQERGMEDIIEAQLRLRFGDRVLVPEDRAGS